jgi:DNA-binding transcriptional ArsR family regulator
MPPPRSVIDLLAEQPDEALLAMQEAVKSELARLTIEAQQIEQALAKKSRRRPSAGNRLTRENVYEAVEVIDSPVTPSEVHAFFTERGYDVSLNSVRNHLSRLVEKDGALVRLDDGRFATRYVAAREAAREVARSADADFVPSALSAEFAPSATDDNVPF